MNKRERNNEENINIIRNCVTQRRRGGDREKKQGQLDIDRFTFYIAFQVTRKFCPDIKK